MNRRHYLASTGIALTTAIAGCSSSDNEQTGSDSDSDNEQGGSSNELSNDLQGPTTEDPRYVDVQYREYSDEDISLVKSNVRNVSYRDMFRDIESYVGEYVSFQGQIIQALEGEEHFTFLISLDQYGEELIYGSWVGGRYLQGDQIEFWAEVLGTETYEMGAGSQNTVPALSIADIEIVE